MYFTAYVPVSGSSTNGYLSLNHENVIGAVSQMDIILDTLNKLWQISNPAAVNFASVAGIYRPCSGLVTPWGTVIHGEEYIASGDANADGYIDAGWLVETNPSTKTVVRKIWAAGRGAHENAAINAAQSILYTANDDATYGFVFKLVLTTPGIDSAGTLYALQYSGTGNLATWLPIANTTQSDRNNTYNLATVEGATNFNGVEDIEISSAGDIYFACKSNGNIYKFTDSGLYASNFGAFVTNKTYTYNTAAGPSSAVWGTGVDNLAFDNDGNLWALQDGDNNNIWKIGPTHASTNEDVLLFGITPLGCEPTGITFTPDGKYLFMSVQHPSAGNTTPQQDAAGNSFSWNTETAFVIARNTELGSNQPLQTAAQLSYSNGELYLTLHATNPEISKVQWQESNDGINFFTINSCEDNCTLKRLVNKPCKVYHRLVFTDQLGNTKITNTVKINDCNINSFSVHNNMLTFDASAHEPAVIFSSTGAQLIQIGSDIMQYDLRSLSAGLYYVKCGSQCQKIAINAGF
jgi:secreted PhoX family phosphatase